MFIHTYAFLSFVTSVAAVVLLVAGPRARNAAAIGAAEMVGGATRPCKKMNTFTLSERIAKQRKNPSAVYAPGTQILKLPAHMAVASWPLV